MCASIKPRQLSAEDLAKTYMILVQIKSSLIQHERQCALLAMNTMKSAVVARLRYDRYFLMEMNRYVASYISNIDSKASPYFSRFLSVILKEYHMERYENATDLQFSNPILMSTNLREGDASYDVYMPDTLLEPEPVYDFIY